MADLRREQEELKQRRAQIDREILALLQKRARLSRDVAAKTPGAIATLPSSERDTIEALASEAGAELPVEAARAVFREIHAVCRALEAPVRVAFTGLEGATSYAAARRQFGALAQLSSASSAEQALSMVEAKQADFAVLPFESAAEGPVLSTLSALRRSDLKIIAVLEEETMPALVSREPHEGPFARLHATAHDRALLEDLGADRRVAHTIIDARSPLAACQAAAQEPGAAALAPEIVGRDAGLTVVSPLDPAARDGRLRLCVLSSRPASRTGKDATALLFTVSDEPGALFEVLKHFAERGVNLRKIQSRPAEGSDGWDYLFFLEVTGHATDRAVVTALEGIKKQTKTLKILGSYPS